MNSNNILSVEKSGSGDTGEDTGVALAPFVSHEVYLFILFN